MITIDDALVDAVLRQDYAALFARWDAKRPAAAAGRTSPPADPGTRHRKAFHEASHAVAKHLLGSGTEGLSLRADGSGIDRGTDDRDNLSFEDELLVDAAGAAGEALYNLALAQCGLWADPARPQVGGDRGLHCEHSGLTGLAADQRWTYDLDRATALLRGRWPAVAAVAQALLTRRYLSRADVAQLVADNPW